MPNARLLTPTDIRDLAARFGIRPTKQRGQNFVHDAGTVRRIVADAGVTPSDRVLEIGPGLGSLTLALLETGALVSAVELDGALAALLPQTIAARTDAPDRFAVVEKNALDVRGPEDLAVPSALRGVGPGSDDETRSGAPGATGGSSGESVYEPTKLVSNLPYNVAVPVLLTLLEVLPSLESAVVMVQLEVADRLAAAPGSKIYGAPSVKAQWYADVKRGAKVSRSVFWPAPNVDSALVLLERHPQPEGASREQVFAIVDAAFAQRRKTLRAALSGWAGSGAAAEEILTAAGVSPSARGETLTVAEFVEIAKAARAHRAEV